MKPMESRQPMRMQMGNMQMQMGEESQSQAGTPSAPGGKRFCSQCGHAVDRQDRFCSACGHRLKPVEE
jgi:predicted amidophosphoribosyltransferase